MLGCENREKDEKEAEFTRRHEGKGCPPPEDGSGLRLRSNENQDVVGGSGAGEYCPLKTLKARKGGGEILTRRRCL
jgi:hypothetical protein